jgi:hypothetical protein
MKQAPLRGPVKRFAESVAVSSTTPVDFPISALADFLVQPLGAASTYFRAALGALVNLGGGAASCKRPKHEKLAFCGFSIINISTAHRAACGKARERSSGPCPVPGTGRGHRRRAPAGRPAQPCGGAYRPARLGMSTTTTSGARHRTCLFERCPAEEGERSSTVSSFFNLT